MSDDSAIGKSNSSVDDSTGESENVSDRSVDRRVSRNVTNPFDSNLLDSLHSSAFSPSVFKTPVTKMKMNSTFQWSIEQKSRMFPVQINDSFTYESPQNSDYEKQVQRAIDRYWATNNLIAPSPDVVSRVKPLNLNFTPSPIMATSLCRRNSHRHIDLSTSPVSRNRMSKESQTDITIPLDFDLETLLEKHLPQRQAASTPKIKRFSSFLERTNDIDDNEDDDWHQRLLQEIEEKEAELENMKPRKGERLPQMNIPKYDFIQSPEATETWKKRREQQIEGEKYYGIKEIFYQERSDEDDTLDAVRSPKEEFTDTSEKKAV